MKKLRLEIISFLLMYFLAVAGFQAHAQNCISEAETRTPWTYIPYCDGDNSYMTVDATSGMANWLEGSFSFDMWLYCTWPYDNGAKTYFFFAACTWDDDNNSMLVYFERNEINTYRLRISDGNDAGGNDDLFYNIDYHNDFQQKWVHITITYDDNRVRLYINGQFVMSQPFVFNRIQYNHIVLGGHDLNHTEDFRGYIAGFRFWKDIKLENADVEYIYPRTFKGVSSFTSDKQFLNDHLKAIMYSHATNVYSIADNNEVGISEKNIQITDAYHPAYPIKPYNLSVRRNCDNLTLNWENNSLAATTNYIYRKKENESGDGTLLCRTNETTYTDDSPDLEPGQNYVYTIRGVWRNPHDSQDIGSEIYQSSDAATITTSLRKYPQIKNFMVVDDASTGNCNGQVKLKWDAIDPTPNEYYIKYKVDNGSYSTLVNGLSATEYIHYVANDQLGKNLTYYVDGGGDACENFSEERAGSANKACSTMPTNQLAVVENGNIKITWDFTQSGAPATAFSIYRSMDGGSFDLLKNEIPVGARTYTDMTAQMCTNYQYKIEAYNACGAIISNATGTVKIPVKFDNVFTYNDSPYFDASKGYFSTKVELEWTVNADKKSDMVNY